MPAVRYSFTLDAVLDADLVRWLELQPNKAAIIREALHAHRARPALADLERKLDQVLDALRGVQVRASNAPALEGGSEPARAVRGLNQMLEKFGGAR